MFNVDGDVALMRCANNSVLSSPRGRALVLLVEGMVFALSIFSSTM